MGEHSAPTTWSTLQRVMRNRNLRRVQGAFAFSVVGDWAYGTAIMVWAYQDAGATAIGLFFAVRLAAGAVFGPLGAVVADRISRRTFMVSSDAIRAVLVTASAVVIAVDGPALVVYGLSIVGAVVGSPFRAAQAGLIPRLVDTPEELTSSNAVAANLENLASFVGPAIGGTLIALTDVPTVFVLNALSFVVSLALVLGVTVPESSVAGANAGPSDGSGEDEEDAESTLQEITAGFRLLLHDADLRAVSLLMAAQCAIAGALPVFLVIFAVRVYEWGPEGIGYLNAILGAATVAGGAVVLTRTAKGRLGRDMVVGLLGWSLSMLLMAVSPTAAVVAIGLVLIGGADPWVNVGFETVPQRIAPDRVLSRVYAAAESMAVGGMAVGALLAPPLLHLVGLRGTLLAFGVVTTAYALWTYRGMERLDARLSAPDTLPLVSSVSLFAPLSSPVQERLARRMTRVRFAAGEVVVREGENSDRFFLIESGTVEVVQGERVLRTEGPGEFFGEIGLLRDVPRTATVTATQDLSLLVLGRADFLGAVVGSVDAQAAAEDVVTRRLAF